MSSVLSSFIPAPHSRLRRFFGGLRVTAAISVMMAAIITVLIGKPEVFFENLVVSVVIGLAAFAPLNAARLAFWDYSDWGLREWGPYVLLALAVAPLAQITGIHAGSLMLGIPPPRLAEYGSFQRAGTILLALIGITLATILMKNRDHLRRTREEHAAQRLRAEVVERQALQAQLRLMQAQIEPHMLFNTLANLQGLIALDPARAADMLDQLIVYLRATLSVSRLETTTLDAEFTAMQAYLGLMGVRMGARLSWRVELPPELRGARLPTMLLQPLVENAIVHGLEPKVDGGEIEIGAGRNGGALEIRVRDTGLGLGRAPSRGGGVGVATTRERLLALYGDAASLTLVPVAPHGTLARLTLPLETA